MTESLLLLVIVTEWLTESLLEMFSHQKPWRQIRRPDMDLGVNKDWWWPERERGTPAELWCFCPGVILPTCWLCYWSTLGYRGMGDWGGPSWSSSLPSRHHPNWWRGLPGSQEGADQLWLEASLPLPPQTGGLIIITDTEILTTKYNIQTVVNVATVSMLHPDVTTITQPRGKADISLKSVYIEYFSDVFFSFLLELSFSNTSEKVLTCLILLGAK